jgi:hypothetical protein
MTATSGKPARYRCPVCHQYPTLTTSGALRGHTYPWHHSQSGDHCPGSGTQVTPLSGQTSLEDIEANPTKGD